MDNNKLDLETLNLHAPKLAMAIGAQSVTAVLYTVRGEEPCVQVRVTGAADTCEAIRQKDELFYQTNRMVQEGQLTRSPRTHIDTGRTLTLA